MARPRLSDETADHINDIYREHAEQEPPDFETALATVLELASAKLEDEHGWRPGDYAKKTMQLVLDDTAKRSAQPSRSASVIDDHTDSEQSLTTTAESRSPSENGGHSDSRVTTCSR